MNSFVKNLFTAFVSLLPLIAWGADSKRDSIANSVAELMDQYPKATLLDIYKSSFQNRYGPGHIIADKSRAKEYLGWELKIPAERENPMFEPTIYDGSYVRVNLATITEGIVPYDTFFDAFLKSAEGMTMPPVEEWAKEWAEILGVVMELYPDLPNLDADQKAIQNRLNDGIYQGEHSRVYVEAYHPHYRIMRKEIFDSCIKPLIDKYQENQIFEE